VSGQLHATANLPQEKSPWYPLDRELGESQSRCGRGEEKNFHHPCQQLNLGHSTGSLVSTDWTT